MNIFYLETVGGEWVKGEADSSPLHLGEGAVVLERSESYECG